MKKNKTIKQLKKELWNLCRKIALKKWKNDCYTCGAKNLVGSNLQLGHFIPSSTCGAYLRFDLRNLRWQCARCNIFAGGNGSEYYRKMIEEVGQKEVDKLFQDKNKIVKADIIFYANKINEYQKINDLL